MTVDSPRTIVLLRHAKADWPDVPDRERPLADRGRLDAPAAGRRFTDDGLTFDLALCSTADRTRETWKLVAHELDHRPKTVYEDRLYDATLGQLIAVVNETPDDVGTLLLVGHNPGIHALADALAGTESEPLARMHRGGFPTAAFAVLTFDGSWKSVEHGVARMSAFWTPHES
ncbi:SixA phosphatase family protein [Actinacidiphila guanduensis]|jgi:phosphohistidine phosphatase|uniref:Phosphohistidine phosphatase n=1 Tax=Actinacidiphila guanduensis TaxID=310781 RepID=A0A1H0E865_9ACTN|nr:histidine phosphatase family protein [Actinacidiphila guanduensis]SDN78498.1 phosphohistidine phosphatase [Actinacidiphila guanduensis]